MTLTECVKQEFISHKAATCAKWVCHVVTTGPRHVLRMLQLSLFNYSTNFEPVIRQTRTRHLLVFYTCAMTANITFLSIICIQTFHFHCILQYMMHCTLCDMNIQLLLTQNNNCSCSIANFFILSTSYFNHSLCCWMFHHNLNHFNKMQ